MKSVSSTFYLVVIFSGFIFMNFQCDNCEEMLHDQVSYSTLLNTLENTINVGDTLILNTSLDSKMELELSGNVHDNSDKYVDYRIEMFEGVKGSRDAIPARNNFDFVDIKGRVTSPPYRDWEIKIENICDSLVCDINFRMIPKRSGYFGIALRNGDMCPSCECKNLSLIPSEVECNGNNNFEIFNEIDISGIRINRAYYAHPESEDLLYFFKVTD